MSLELQAVHVAPLFEEEESGHDGGMQEETIANEIDLHGAKMRPWYERE